MEYLFTEQAHLMCPNMSFGIVALLRGAYAPQKIRDTVQKLSEAHPFLRAGIVYDMENRGYAYSVTEQPQTEIFCKDGEVNGIEDPAVLTEYERLTSREWNLLMEGMLKISAWKAGEKTCVLLAFHHLLTDGRGALGLMQEFADCYVNGRPPEYVPERLLAKEDFPNGSELPAVSRFLVRRANKQWEKENHRLSYAKYLRFADEWLAKNGVQHTLTEIGEKELAETVTQCRENGVTVNDWLTAKMFLEDGTDKIILAADLRDKIPAYTAGALGNFSTAFSVVYKRKKADIFAAAKDVHALIQKKMTTPKELWLVLQCYAETDKDLLDSAFISAQGGYASKAGKFLGTAFFGFDSPKAYSITNLGKTESDSIETAYFIPPCSPAARKTVGVLTLNGKMISCISERKR